MVMKVGTIPAGQFKAKCLKLMDEVQRTRRSIVITKRGKAIAQLGPVSAPPAKLIGSMSGLVEILGDIVAPLDVDWGPGAPP
jgi:prevent-host-death family protein